MSKILGLDYGKRRTGIAISDPARELAFPRKTLSFRKEGTLFKEIKKLCEEEAVEKIIVGLPLNMQGHYTKQTESTEAFANRLKGAIDLPIELFDERLSTLQAEKALIEKGLKKYSEIDEIAAQMVLQAWLDRSA
ncbi:MAG: Holliday junction resolvase RuvX [Patescibacteria group bacterium]|nr:Holliday junction resolvase RuvX [Patescibacteria group bacterium]